MFIVLKRFRSGLYLDVELPNVGKQARVDRNTAAGHCLAKFEDSLSRDYGMVNDVSMIGLPMRRHFARDVGGLIAL